jgi:dTDP-4-dehydrorhamnose 3,5-epimerase
MIIEPTSLKDCIIIHPSIFKDDRGYFFESYSQNKFEDSIGKSVKFIQDNESYSTKGVLRGLHFQTNEFAQAKLVRVVMGEVLDVALDLRPNSNTFGKHFSVKLSEKNKKQLFIPRGFAHGFVVLSDTAVLSYKCDNFYNKKYESGIIFNDKTLNIDWQTPINQIKLSEKDLTLPTFKELFS